MLPNRKNTAILDDGAKPYSTILPIQNHDSCLLTRIELAWNRSKQSALSQKVQVVQRTTIRCFAEKNSAPDLEQTSELRGHNQIKNHKNFWDLSQRISSTPSPCFVEQVSTANLQHAFPSMGRQVSCVDTSN